jgi:hypothetical protein
MAIQYHEESPQMWVLEQKDFTYLYCSPSTLLRSEG